MLYNDIANVPAVKSGMIEALDNRKAWEIERADTSTEKGKRALDSKLKFLFTFRKKCETADAFTLGYLATKAFTSFQEVFMSHRRTTAAFNIYAMTKFLLLARVLNGSSLDTEGKGDNGTLIAVILCLASGEGRQAKIIDATDAYMRRFKADYNAGNTQASSSLRALEAHGIVKRNDTRDNNTQVWQIKDSALFTRVHEAAQGIRAESVTEEQEEAAFATDSDSATKAGRAASRNIKRAKGGGKARSKAGKGQEGETSVAPAIPAPEEAMPLYDVPLPPMAGETTEGEFTLA